jgi:WD40 repeat protein
MFTGLDDGTIVLWDVRSGRELDTFSGHADSVVSVAASPDGAWLLSSGQDRTISLWSVDEAAVVVKYPLRQAPIAGFFVPEGLFVLDCTGVFTLFEIHNLDSMHAEAAA